MHAKSEGKERWRDGVREMGVGDRKKMIRLWDCFGRITCCFVFEQWWVEAYMCVHVCIWITLALGGGHLAWHVLSAWLNSDPVLEVSLSLHIKYTPADRHTTLPTESSLQDYPKFLLAFLPSFPHVIIMDCVRILNLSSLELFYPPSLFYSAFFLAYTFLQPINLQLKTLYTDLFAFFSAVHFHSNVDLSSVSLVQSTWGTQARTIFLWYRLFLSTVLLFFCFVVFLLFFF